MSCEPCKVTVKNSAACESLPSQISNFTTQFFGTVQKTEVDGEVAWVLPCGLDVGLPNNPRLADEGLACYFLRLFEDGIVGLTGPQGPKGNDGTNGDNAYAVTLSGFTQPTLSSPQIQVFTNNYSQALGVDSYVYITNSGYYLVTATDAQGTMWLTLTRAINNPDSYHGVGRLIVPTGYPGESITGPQGPQGPTGPQGTPGESFTATNAFYSAAVGTDFTLSSGVYSNVDFINSEPQVTLGARGRYHIKAVVAIEAQATVATSDLVEFRLQNTANGLILSGSEQGISFLSNGQRAQVVIDVHFDSDTNGVTLRLQGKTSGAGTSMKALALKTTMTAVRLS